MSNNKISYTSRDYTSLRSDFLKLAKEYYPDVAVDFDDASIGSWIVDVIAGATDEMNYHIDRVYQETNINSAQQSSSVYSLARSNGFKIPGPKGAMTEVEFSCKLPVNGSTQNSPSTERVPNWEFAPTIKRGTKVSGGGQVFEVLSDINFAEQFDENGVSNRTIVPERNSNGLIISYTIKKLSTVVAGETQIYKRTINSSDIIPFMEFTLPTEGVMNVESIIFKEGQNFQSDPSMKEFMTPKEEIEIDGVKINRFFEVESLIDDSIWTIEVDAENNPVKHTYGYDDNGTIIPTASVTKGQWLPLKQKFISEYTDNNYLKIIFGNGIEDNTNISDANDFNKYQLSKLMYNNALGILPNSNTTMYVLYRSGGGITSNVGKGAITSIAYLDVSFASCIKDANDRQIVSNIKNSISVVNTIPSVSGKDMPTVNELKYMIKYNNSAQNRCVTPKDYYNRIMQLPAKYGTPFRVGVGEANNKIMINTLGVNYLGQLTTELPNILVENIKNYLSEYKMINDFVEIKSGKIINLSFELDLFVDKNYNTSDVVVEAISTIKNYMDINEHVMGGDIFIGDIMREISDIDGILNVIGLRVYNEYGDGYSPTQSTQSPVTISTCGLGSENNSQPIELGRFQIDTTLSDGMLYTESDTMFEIKFPEKDIKVRVKTR